MHCRRSVHVTDREVSGESGQGTGQQLQYSLVPVDRYGDSKDNCPPLTDKGKSECLCVSTQQIVHV